MILGNILLSFFLYTYVRRLVIRYGDGSTYLKPSSEIMKRFAILDVFLNGVNLWKKKCLSFEVEAKGVCRGGGGVGPAKRGDPGWAPAGSGMPKTPGVNRFCTHGSNSTVGRTLPQSDTHNQKHWQYKGTACL